MKSMLVIALAAVVVLACNAEFELEDACQLSPLVLSNSKVTVDNSNCNQTFKAQDFIEKPSIKWKKGVKGNRYTFLLVGTHKHFHKGVGTLPNDYTFFLMGTTVNFHWAVSDIPGTTLEENGNITTYNEISEYLPLTRNPGIGAMKSYRYQAIIFRQRSSFRRTARPDPAPERVNFNLTKFVKELDLIEKPVAAIQAWIDPDSLPIIF